MTRKIRVLLVDDHPIVIAGLKAVLGEWEEFDTAGVAYNGKEAVELNRRLRPDLIIMDMRMPELTGPEAIRKIKDEFPNVRILAFSAYLDEEMMTDAMRAGCDGFLLKAIDQQKFRASLRSIVDGIDVFDESVITSLRVRSNTEEARRFSQRELVILDYLCQGMTNPEIAVRLELKTGTVKNLISLLFNKTNCSSRAQLVRYAISRHLTE